MFQLIDRELFEHHILGLGFLVIVVVGHLKHEIKHRKQQRQFKSNWVKLQVIDLEKSRRRVRQRYLYQRSHLVKHFLKVPRHILKSHYQGDIMLKKNSSSLNMIKPVSKMDHTRKNVESNQSSKQKKVIFPKRSQCNL